MTDTPPSPLPTARSQTLLARYKPYSGWVEPGYWIVLYMLSATMNSLISIMDVERAHAGYEAWEPVVWQWSSHLVGLALVPVVIAFERRVPLHFGSLRRNLPWHALASVVYCAVHVAAMVGLRKHTYAWFGSHYNFGNWPRELFYEYLKDWRTYSGILLIVAGYRLLLLRLQGEARLLDAPDDETEPVEPLDHPKRFLVRKLGKEFLVAASDIEFLQASGNYVNLRVHGRDYPLRTTMAAIETRMDPTCFVRVHRSWMVNVDCIAEIETLDTGDARLLLRDGTKVPCSRRYRAALKQ